MTGALTEFWTAGLRESEQIEADLLAILERDDDTPRLVPKIWTQAMYDDIKASNERVRRLLETQESPPHAGA